MGTPFREPGWAEFFLPLQAIEVQHIQIEEPKKPVGPGIPLYAIDRPIAALSYSHPNYRMPILNILTPFLKVHSWDSLTGRLELEVDISSQIAMKCSLIQEHFIHLLSSNLHWLLPYTQSKEELRENFQEIIHDQILSIYLHGPNPEKKQTGRVWIWNKPHWQKGASGASFKKGQQIRVALRFQGICFLQTSSKKMKYRIQHQTISIFHKSNN